MSMNMTVSLPVSGMSRESAVEFRRAAIQMIRVIENEYQLPTVLAPPKSAGRKKTAIEKRLRPKVGE